MCLLILTSRLYADITTLTVSASANQTNTTQLVIQTNVTAKLLHYYLPNGGSGLTIQVNGLNFPYDQNRLDGNVNNLPTITGPATISLWAGQTYGSSSAMCTISTESNQSTTVVSNYVPADAIVIPASDTGNVQIILESSPDLVNWTAAEPGIYGASAGTNRFFRVRAIAQ